MRAFSIPGRRKYYVDLMTPLVSGVALYRLKWAQNFDQAPVLLLDSTNVGMVSASIQRNTIDATPTDKHVRIVFDPTDYGIDDDKAFWVQLFHVISGVEGETEVSPLRLVLPASAHQGSELVLVQGEAPSAADVTGSQELHLPKRMTDVRIHNRSAATDLYVAFEPGGLEQLIKPDTGPAFTQFSAMVHTLLVRGDGAPCDFSLTCTLAFPK